MPTQQQIDIKGRIERRVELSEPMLKAMGVTPDAYARAALNALVLNPKIADCTLDSVETAIIHAVNAKLVPDGREAAIVPYGGNATFVPMIEGQVKLALAATPGLTLRARLVYGGDEWVYEEGLRPILRHVPTTTSSRSDDDIVAAYAVADVPGADNPAYEVMLRGDLDRHKGYSRAQGSHSPWQRFYGPMCMKTVIRQLVKRLPKPSGTLISEAPPGLEAVEIDGPTFMDDTVSGAVTHPVARVQPEQQPVEPLPRPKRMADTTPQPVQPTPQPEIVDGPRSPVQEAQPAFAADSPF